MSQIKICGLFRPCDIDYVNEAGPDYAGFILHFPKSHRNLTAENAALLRKRLRPEIKAVGVFVNQPLATVCADAEMIGLDIIQLHGLENEAYIVQLRQHVPLPVWKAFRIKNAADLRHAAASSADEILLDNGYGTGKTYDWSLTEGFERQFILAGGLTPENIPEAIRTLHPKMLDISSGVETDRLKDREKIIAAVTAARRAQSSRTSP